MGLEKTFFVGDKAPEEGKYICVPCGYRETFQKGDIFPECVSCLDSQKDIKKEDLADEGTWEKITE